jgi:lauroyl/myristoyl acyltransferase
LSDTLRYYAFRILAGLIGHLPEPVMRRLGYGLGYLGSFVAPRRLRMAERHQRRVLGPDANHRRAARRVFGYYGRYWAETFWLHPRHHRFLLEASTLDNLEILKEAIASPRGIVLALGHVGNWEVAGLRGAAEGARVLAVAEALADARIVEWWVSIRNMMDIDVVIARRGAKVTRDLTQRLEEGGVVALLSDRDLKGTGVPVMLFGEETTLPAGPIALACRTGAIVLPVGTYFKRGAGHRFQVYPPLQIPEEGDLEQRVAEGTRLLAEVLEGIIRQAPQQWHLLMPNWPSDKDPA